MRYVLSILVLLAAAPAAGQIQIERTYAPYKPIVAKVAMAEPAPGAKQQTIARWRVSGSAERVVVDDGRTVHIWAPPGSYDVVAELITVNWTDQTIKFAEHTASFVVTGSGPQPPDPPVPTPTTLWVTVVEETGERTIEQGRVYTSEQLHAYLAGGNHRWRILDDDVTDENGAPPQAVATYLARARGKTLPWVIVANSAGDVLWEGTLPATASELLATLKRYGGD